ncbi:response regulator [Geminocystis sp. GBBB08]|uniref:response regulator n=1 Tax=Geminocystis sp. GBBB08 TaxID=2604140 RepID=UPI0027E3464C|nr:response regulator [Geminocystis sp. GBBB08]MBL1209071.1 response regulator [Geminocystis sp. GBBB08]
MLIKTNTVSKLKETINTLAKESKNGVLVCKYKEVIGEIHFFSGKLIYTVIYKHRVRRWKRALLKAGIHTEIKSITFEDEQPWEYQLFSHELAHKKIGMTQVKDIIRTVAEEVFFELSGYLDLEMQWQDKIKSQSGLALVLALSNQEVNLVIENACKLREDWDAQGLKTLSPTLAPMGKTSQTNESFSWLLDTIDGKLSLWDLALKNKKSINELGSLLIPYIRKGVVKFKEIPDLNISNPQPVSIKSEVVEETQEKKSTPSFKSKTAQKKSLLIACIDDSPVVAHNIKKILIPAGYEVLAIPEPMHGFSQLIEHQPQLILLDINMPNANGYSVCQFLRNSPIFEKTPIIILTGQDTNIDRARAKLVGATDFMAKPPDEKVLLLILKKYLN